MFFGMSKIIDEIFGNINKKHYLCSKLLKLRHSFLNGYGRLRTAFLLYRHWHYDTTRNVLYRWLAAREMATSKCSKMKKSPKRRWRGFGDCSMSCCGGWCQVAMIVLLVLYHRDSQQNSLWHHVEREDRS